MCDDNLTPPGPRRFIQRLMVIAVMLIFFAQSTFGSLHLSMTADEPTQLAGGYVILTTGDTWTVPANGPPPLINAWATWPVLLQPERPNPYAVPGWRQDDLTGYTRALSTLLGPIERLTFIIRFPIMLLAVVLMALVYRWARDWFGHWGGLFAIAVMAWDPTMVAHSQLSTTDLGVTLFAFACVYSLNRLLLRSCRSWRHIVGVGLLLGAAMGAKSSGTALVPVVLAMLGWGYVRETGHTWKALLRRQAHSPAGWKAVLWAGGRWATWAATILGAAILVLWGAYAFEWRALPGMSFPVPLATHIRMMQTVFEDKDRLSFLWGQHQKGGWWWYFPFAFAIKTPIPLIIGLATALIAGVRKGRSRLGDEMALWLFPLVYVATAIPSGLNIGYRHMMPILPFVYVSIGRLASWLLQTQSRWRHAVRWAAAALGAWYILGTLQVYPFALAYFNELVGGPRNGYHYLVDSNLDWGQSFKALKIYMEQAGIRKVWLSYYTYIDPGVYGVNYESLYPAPDTQPALVGRFDPPPGVYAISATTLQGITPFPDLYDWFRHQQPTAQPGYGLLVYHVPDNPRGQWVAQCTVPQAPMSPESMAEGFGINNLRQVQFDCTQSWVYPDSGRSPGWYGFYRDTWLHGDSFVRNRLAPTRLTYQQDWYYDEPPLALFQWASVDSPPPAWAETLVRVAPSEWAPSRVETSVSARAAPIALEGPLTFLGYQLLSASAQHVELATAWRVEATPTRPLVLAARLVTAKGAPVASADGLGVPINQWRAGDILIQRHRLSMPDGSPHGADWIQITAYWQDTQTRWQAIVDGETAGDQLLAPLAAAR